MKAFHFLIAVVVIAGAPVLSRLAWTQQPGATPLPPPAPLELDDLKLLPAGKLSERQQDDREALALFAAARRAQQQEKNSEALRLYQRALRRDAKQSEILGEVVRLATKLKRPAVWERYALMAADADPDNAKLLQQLAFQLSTSDAEKAAGLYERLMKLEKPSQRKTPRHVVLAMESGRLHFLAGKFELSARRFDEVLRALDNAKDFGLNDEMRTVLLGRNAASTYIMFGEAFLKAGRIKQAREALETGYAVNRDKVTLAYQLARVHLAAGEAEKAKSQLEKYFAAEDETQRTGPYRLLADVLEKLGKKNELPGELERLRAARAKSKPGQPQSLYLTYFLAEHLRETAANDGDRQQAEKLFQQVAQDPRVKEKHKALAATVKLSLLRLYRDGKQAGPLLDLLGDIAGRTGDLQALGEMGDSIAKDKDLLASLIQTAQQRKKQPEFDFGRRLAAALLAVDAKKYELAGEFFESAMQAKPESASEVRLAWGFALLVADRDAEAAAVLQRGIDDDLWGKKNPTPHYYLAMALELAGKTEAAVAAARQAIKIDEENPRLHSRLGWIYYHARQYEKAEREYAALLKKFDPIYVSANDRPQTQLRQTMRETRLILSNICVFQKNLPQAEEWIEQVLDEFPGDTGAYNDLGYLWADQGKRLRRSLQMVRKAVAAEPDNAAYRDSLGWTLYRLGRYDEALVELEKAVNKEDPDGVILDHLGDAYLQTRQVDKALKTWKRALKKFDQKQDADKIEATKKKIEMHQR